MSIWSWPNTVIKRVLDGDSVDAEVARDIGFEGVVRFPVRLRLARINAPKLTSVRGKAARARVVALTDGIALDITTTKGYKYGAPADRTGEYMAEIVLPDGRNLSDVLVVEGLATYWDGEGPRPADT